MVRLNDLVKIFPHTIKPKTCRKLIEIYEENKSSHERLDNDRRPNFTQLNFTNIHRNNREYANIHQSIVSIIKQKRDEYFEFVHRRCFPDTHQLEFIRIKKYENNGEDEFDTHVDVIDHSSAKRYLAYLWYLNDIEEGGETNFDGLTIRPESGKLLVFPPMWMFPHNGKPPVSEPKYIMSTYLHYKDGKN